MFLSQFLRHLTILISFCCLFLLVLKRFFWSWKRRWRRRGGGGAAVYCCPVPSESRCNLTRRSFLPLSNPPSLGASLRRKQHEALCRGEGGGEDSSVKAAKVAYLPPHLVLLLHLLHPLLMFHPLPFDLLLPPFLVRLQAIVPPLPPPTPAGRIVFTSHSFLQPPTPPSLSHPTHR